MPPTQKDLCAPICHSARPFSECLVANVTIRHWATKELSRAGFDIVETSRRSAYCIRLPINHNIELGVLTMLARTERSAVLKSVEGEVLAWKGVDDPDMA